MFVIPSGIHATPITQFVDRTRVLIPSNPVPAFEFIDMPTLSHLHSIGTFDGKPENWNIFYNSASAHIAGRRENCDTFNISTWTNTTVIPLRRMLPVSLMV